MGAMEERIQRPATTFTPSANADAVSAEARSFSAPTVVEVSLCCEISAYAPDEGDQPLF